MKEKAVFVNGEILEEDYVTRNESACSRDNFGPIIVPQNHYFVLGDNRDNSSDSREWGTIARNKITGRPSLVYFSFKQDILFIRFDRIGKRI